MKTFTVPAHHHSYCADIPVEAMRFILPEDISVSGIASINEIYDGDPPHNPRGAVSQAWSVGAILRIAQMIEAYEIKK